MLASLGAARAQQVVAPSLGQAAAYGLLSGTSIRATDNAGQPLPIWVQGKAGAKNKIGSGVTASGGRYELGSGTVPPSLTDAQKAGDYCTNLGGTSLASQLDGQTLAGGAYQVAGNATLGPGAQLTLTGDTATIIILNVTGSLALGAQAQVVFGGVRPQHVFWNVTGNVTFAPRAATDGVFLAGGDVTATSIHYGLQQLLAQGAIELSDLPEAFGTRTFYAAAWLNRLDPSCTLPAATTCGNQLANGDFEVYRQCPISAGNIQPANAAGLSDVCRFVNVGMGTADYFNRCAGTTVGTTMGVPYNFGTPTPRPRSARSGTGYAGATSAPNTSSGLGVREYFGQTIAQLQAGRTYYGAFWVSQAGYSWYSARTLGMYLSAGQPTATGSPAGIYQTPTISGNPNTAGTNWVLIDGLFTATGNENFVTLGCFDPDNTISAGPYPNGGGGHPGAYYFYDDLALVRLPDAGLPQTVTCASGPVTIGENCPLPAELGATYQWSPTTGLSSPNQLQTQANPAQATTYTLTITVGNRVTQSTVLVDVDLSGCCPGSIAPANLLGQPGQTTTLSGGATYAGTYRVQGNLRLTDGDYTLTPGTIFYVDGVAYRQPTASGVDERAVKGCTITLGEGARLVLDGATITASGSRAKCPMWRGIVVEGNLPVGSPAQVDIRNGSVVSHAYCALTILRTATTALGTAYSLTESSFLHNLTHVLDMGIRKGAGKPALIQNCTFDADPALMHYPYNASFNSPTATDQYVTYQAMQLLPYTDADADAVQVTDNTINHAVYGIVNNVTGGNQTNVLIAGNTLKNIYQTGIWTVDNQAQPASPGAVPTVSDNSIRLSSFGGQVTEQLPAGATLFGITTENSQPVYRRSAISHNNVFGEAGSSKPQVGLSLYYQTDASSNTLQDLSEGIRTTSLDDSHIFDNATQRCESGVTVQPRTPYGYQAQMGCNSFYRSGASGFLRGIWAVPDAEFNDQGDPSAPAGNVFAGMDEKVRNDGIIGNPTPIKYYQTTSLLEAVSTVAGYSSGQPINTQISGSYCTGPNGNGVSRGLPPSPDYIAALADTVRRQLVPRAKRRAYLNEVLHYYLGQGRAIDLEAWWTTLLPLNPEDYRTTGLQLLHAYDRQAATAADAQRVLTALQPQAALNADLAAELDLRQIERHLPKTAPLLATADSTALTMLAWSGTAAAGRAGRWLRYFHPRLEVPTTSPDPLRTTARPVAAPPVPSALTAQLGEAYPNPAHTEVQIACQLPMGATSGVLRLTDLVTGRTVREVPVPADEQAQPLRVSLNGLAAGAYAYRLLVDGRPVAGARKLVVMP